MKTALRAGLAGLILSIALPANAEVEQATYASAEEAVSDLAKSARSGDIDAIAAVLGPEGREIASSGDEVADADARNRFLSAFDQSHEIRQSEDGRSILYIGEDEFPFPIPLVTDNGRWRFDTEAGAEEIFDRRIGENELSAVEVLRTFVDAEREYAETDRDGKGVQYARRLLSQPDATDGLYWPTGEGEPESPLGPLVADAQSEGYKARSDGPTPFHGYIFRVLTAQGEHAPGGAQDYLINDRMIGGFGLLATPAEYGNSGVATFIVNHDGVVYERDLGEDTDEIAATINAFDPGPDWKPVPAR
ncbi:DUF2950 domain-containing protein [Hyphomicrobium sp.]|uniref:DUF2950 domain-containing protein n=1 Tax=Hyphomicrobium sp. TaxID=82 RepID=UPI003D0E87F4